jgi:nucleoid DNA-binding protein
MISKKDFFLQWPYKCAYQGNTIPRPYFSKTEVNCNHKHSLTYNEWNEIITVYLDCLMDYIVKGNKFEIPNMLGYFEMCKWKRKFAKPTGTPEKNEDGTMKKRYNSARTMLQSLGYSPILKWRRSAKLCKLKFKSIWAVKMLKDMKKKASKQIVDNPLMFNDV